MILFIIFLKIKVIFLTIYQILIHNFETRLTEMFSEILIDTTEKRKSVKFISLILFSQKEFQGNSKVPLLGKQLEPMTLELGEN